MQHQTVRCKAGVLKELPAGCRHYYCVLFSNALRAYFIAFVIFSLIRHLVALLMWPGKMPKN